jgi:surface carbohydrate biosynthesis protein
MLNMNITNPLFLIPVENQMREFDAKLLLACVAAKRGFFSIIGPRRDVEFCVTSVPRSIFVSKDLRSGNGRFFRTLTKLGHVCIGWDEEALVHHPPESYYSSRLSPMSTQYVSHMFAWGQENADLWRQYPQMPADKPIHTTGNPRGDMLRPELNGFYKNEFEGIRQAYGDFLLINTNFAGVNAFIPVHEYLVPGGKHKGKQKWGRAARGLNQDFVEGIRNHFQSIFEDFQRLIPELEQAFPNLSVVVRPHPTEDHEIYHNIAAKCKRVYVTNEGNVIPWLIAAKALIHNGCTTGVEAYAMGVPALAYRATVNDDYDNFYFQLPNLLSHQCFNFEELREVLQKILRGNYDAVNEDERKTLFSHYLTAQEGPLACERIVEVLAEVTQGWSELPKPALSDRLEGWYRATRRRLLKQINSYLPDASIPPDYQRYRYPGISLEDVRMRVSRLQQVLNDSTGIRVDQFAKKLFIIST